MNYSLNEIFVEALVDSHVIVRIIQKDESTLYPVFPNIL